MKEIIFEQPEYTKSPENLAIIWHGDVLGSTTGTSVHWHKAVEVTLILQNVLQMKSRGKTVRIEAGDFNYVNSGEPHQTEAYYKDERIRYMVVVLSDEMFKSVCSDFDRYRLDIPPGHPGRKPIIESLQRIYACRQHPTPCDQVLINGELWRIVYLLLDQFRVPKEDGGLPPAEQKDYLAKQAMEYIDQNFQSYLTLEMVAGKVGLQPNYFCRYFKKYVGMSVGQYLAQARLRYALAYMTDFGASVVESAFQAGFSSASAFNDCCKRVYGITPTQYRQLQQKEQK